MRSRSLFDPFRRGAQPASGHSSAGLGLGLFIASEIARAHGGALAATSDAEHGTTFTLTLPRAASDGDAAAPPG